jgi:uncharacterized protein YdhG (YjbR/CyaY superfamily)
VHSLTSDYPRRIAIKESNKADIRVRYIVKNLFAIHGAIIAGKECVSKTNFNYHLTVPAKDPSREAHFPAIEKKYGEKMDFWFAVMKVVEGQKYPEQIAHLRENYGFSQAHANALVMYSRGSVSAKKFETPAAYYKTISPMQAKTMRAIFKAITTKYPKAELVIAWNQPMIRVNGHYIFGASAATKHILIAPWSTDVIAQFADKMAELDVKKKTIGIPNDWDIDTKLILGMVKARLAECK